MESSSSSRKRWSSRRTSSLLKTPRLSINSAVGNESNSQPLPAHLETADEHPVLDPKAFPAVARIRHSDDGTISDDGSGKHIIRKTIQYDVRSSPQRRR
jgi:hypothetical protein